jgi:EAL domain-containing protein (putative c-di-GMP-specific phosphodiesterase class I)
LAVCINVSPATVLSGRLREVLTGVPLDRVVLEMTEHARVSDYGALTAALAPWRAAGVRLAVDDAGAGYASFAHILNVAPEFIKLDTSLIHEIHIDRQRQALARALIAYASEMDVAVIAEGIETQAELDTVAGLGAHFAQGFHLGRPRPLSEQPQLADTVVELRSLEPEAEVDLREPAHDDIDHRG